MRIPIGFYCPVCGVPKTHHRTVGYRCNNPEHQEIEAEWTRQIYAIGRERKQEIKCENCGNHVLPQGAYCERCGVELGEYRGDGVK